jgi:transcription initiation factor TFIIIB Brf1 subunit/transcription initiation factor TFIIB
MTLPYERTRAVIQTGDFLHDIVQNLELPATVRDQAHRLLRHYPSKSDMHRAGLIEERSADVLLAPVFASSVEAN